MRRLVFETLTSPPILSEVAFFPLLPAHPQNADEKTGEDGLKAEGDKGRSPDDEPHDVGVIRVVKLLLVQNFGETPDLVKSVVKRCGSDADDVWFAEIANHARGFQFIE